MLRHAARAVPWWLVLTAAALLLGLLALVRWRAWVLWPLEGTAVGLVAAAVGWCLDEPAAAVVDPAPRGLAWRTGARCCGAAVVVAAWSAGVWWARGALFGHALGVLLQGYVAAVVGVAWATWRRASGEATPGLRWALVVVPLATAWALIRPLPGRLPVFPYASGGRYGDWAASSWGWTIAGLLAAAALAAALAAPHGITIRTVARGRGTSGSASR